MENNNIINNNEEVKPKRVYTEAQIKAVKAYRERNRDSEEYKQRQRVNSKKSETDSSLQFTPSFHIAFWAPWPSDGPSPLLP